MTSKTDSMKTYSAWHQSVSQTIEWMSKISKKGTHTWATVLDGSVRARELSEVVACHLRLDLDGVEYL